jgi:hypothetical protein
LDIISDITDTSLFMFGKEAITRGVIAPFPYSPPSLAREGGRGTGDGGGDKVRDKTKDLFLSPLHRTTKSIYGPLAQMVRAQS